MKVILEHFVRYAAISIVGFLAAIHLAMLSAPSVSEYGGKEGLAYAVFIAVASLVLAALIKRGWDFILKLIEWAALLSMAYILFYALTLSEVFSGVAALIIFILRLIEGEAFMPASSLILASGAIVFLSLSFNLLFILALVLALSIYDYISVYITKHMITLAKGVERSKSAAIVEVKKKILSEEGEREVGLTMGLGDLVFPATLAANVGSKNLHLGVALLIAQFIGYWFVVWLLKNRKGYLPALPPILLPQLLLLLAFFLIYK